MFNEVLRIKPRLSAADTAKMERSLSQRFQKVSKSFAKGLKNAVKGSVLGIGLAFLAQLLNPLQELEERIKEMLGKGDDLNERAAKLGTTPGALRALETLAAGQGLDSEKTAKLLDAFASSVEAAKTELDELAKDPTKEMTAGTAAVQKFITNPDQADAFFKFLQSLQSFGKANGLESRQKVEKAVFGERLYGNSRRFLESNIGGDIAKLPGPTQEQISKGAGKLGDLNRLMLARQAVNETTDMVSSAGKLSPGIIQTMTRREAEEQQHNRSQIDDYQKLVKAAEAIQGLTTIVKEIKDYLFQALGVLRDIQIWLNNLLPSLNQMPSINGIKNFVSGVISFGVGKGK